MLIPPLPPLCVCVTSAFRSLPVHCRDPASYRFGRVASPPPRLSDIHWLHMALLCNNTFEFQSLFGRLHCQPTTALHAHTRPGIQMRCRVFSCGIFFFFLLSRHSVQMQETMLFHLLLSVWECAHASLNYQRKWLTVSGRRSRTAARLKIVHQAQDLTLSLSTSEKLS